MLIITLTSILHFAAENTITSQQWISNLTVNVRSGSGGDVVKYSCNATNGAGASKKDENTACEVSIIKKSEFLLSKS